MRVLEFHGSLRKLLKEGMLLGRFPGYRLLCPHEALSIVPQGRKSQSTNQLILLGFNVLRYRCVSLEPEPNSC
jgi:hypothetical protein